MSMMKHFNENRELVEGEPCEFWDDCEYQPSMDESYHQWMQPKWDKERKAWLDKLRSGGMTKLINGALRVVPPPIKRRME